MTRFTSTLAAILLTASVSAATAQTPARGSAPQAFPRVDLGGGCTAGVPLTASDGPLPMANVRVGVALTRTWALEGVFDLWPEPNGMTTVYRAQARRQLRGGSAPGSLQTHLIFGAAGSLSHHSYAEHRWQDASGTMHVYPARSYWNAGPPIYPTIGFGVQKTLSAHVALRADLAAIIVPFDDGAAVLLMPSVSISIPIGRYTTSPTR